MIDAGVNEQIFVTNVIVPVCSHVDLHTADKHIDIDFVGSGPCDLFVGGRHIAGQWIKRDDMSRTRYGTPMATKCRSCRETHGSRSAPRRIR
jgi:hypothetical protein